VIYTVLLLFKTSCFVKDIDISRLSMSLISKTTIEMPNAKQSRLPYYPPTHSEHRALKKSVGGERAYSAGPVRPAYSID
jgi:hypothetical protein